MVSTETLATLLASSFLSNMSVEEALSTELEVQSGETQVELRMSTTRSLSFQEFGFERAALCKDLRCKLTCLSDFINAHDQMRHFKFC